MPAATFILISQTAKILWARFDSRFYTDANPACAGIADPDLLLDHYLMEGAPAGFSPNRWFDESYYLAANPDVAALVRDGDYPSGFAHYCSIGHVDRAPHWLFDPAFYQASNPALTDESLEAADFVNGYDHYLKFGAAENRLAHPFFVPATYIAALPPEQAAEADAQGAFAHFLSRGFPGEAGMDIEPRVSSMFDPDWYRSAYPEAAEQVRAGIWQSCLHHYLVYGKAAAFNPLPPTQDSEDIERGPPKIKIHIDRPAIGNGEALEPITGDLDIIGWAAADLPLDIDIFVDDQYCGRAHHGIRTEGVAAAFPEFVHAMFAGLRFVGPSPVATGRHRLRVVARDESGQEQTTAFDADFIAEDQRDGPGSLRRRMRRSESDFKLGLLRNAGQEPHFIIVLRQGSASNEATKRTLASLDRQAYPYWSFSGAAHAPGAGNGWVVPLDAGDELGADGLLELALHRLTEPAADFLYSDERCVDPTTSAVAPFFKPDWSPDLLLSFNYIGRLWAASCQLVAKSCIALNDLAVMGDYDCVLRLTENAAHIAHVARVLCERATALPGAADDALIALQAAIERRGVAGTVEPGLLPHLWRVRRAIAHPPLVSVIIPTAGARGLIETALKTLRACTDYPRYEVIVIDTVPAVEAAWKTTMHSLADRVIADSQRFNWSRVNNDAACGAQGEILLFLNDDVVFNDPGWLTAMVEQAARPDVAVVGARLLFPDGMVQHAGIFLTHRSGRHAFYGMPADAPGPFGLALSPRDVSAVTGACLMARTELFEELGGFDERLDISCNDLDFCLRALDAGFLVAFTPYAVLTHYESVTRIGLPELHNERLFGNLWRRRLARRDPYFNRNLSLAHCDFRPEREFCEHIHPGRPLAAPETIRRILAIKLDHIGDFLLSLPALRRLKHRFPKAEITLLAAPGICEIAALEPAIDRAIAFEFFNPRSGMGPRDIDSAELATLTDRLRAERFDLAIDLRRHTETRPLLQASGATWLAGFDPDFDFPWLDIVAKADPDSERKAKRAHSSDNLSDLADKIAACFPSGRTEPTGLVPPPWPNICPIPPADRLCVAIHPGVGNAMRQWPPDHFATLIDWLTGTRDCQVVLVGSEEESDLAAQILAMIGNAKKVVSVVGLTTVKDMAGLIAGCDLFIGNNSGPHHLAASMNVPTIGIHSGVVDSREWGPNGPSAVAVSRRMVCSPCYIAKPEDCPRALACLTELSPDSVIALAQTMLAGRPDRSSRPMPAKGAGKGRRRVASQN